MQKHVFSYNKYTFEILLMQVFLFKKTKAFIIITVLQKESNKSDIL